MNCNQYASKTNIKISSHAMQRVKERTCLSVKNEIMKYISQARYYGIHIRNLSRDNIIDFKISVDFYHFLKGNFYSYASDELILYKDNVFCFTGHKNRTLKTVINIPNKFKGWWK